MRNTKGKEKHRRPTLYFPKTSLVNPYLEETYNQKNRFVYTSVVGLNIINSGAWAYYDNIECGRGQPQVHDVVFVVPPVQMDIMRVDQQEPEQDEQDLQRVFATIHQVAVEDIRFLRGRQAILHRLFV